MPYWKIVLQEILNKTQPTCMFTAINREKGTIAFPINKKTRQKTIKAYPLGNKYPGIAFSQREAECMVGLFKGKTIIKVAESLSLSKRTVEFYLKNMKNKLNCKTKSELLGKVIESDFMQYIDFEYS